MQRTDVIGADVVRAEVVQHRLSVLVTYLINRAVEECFVGVVHEVLLKSTTETEEDHTSVVQSTALARREVAEHPLRTGWVLAAMINLVAIGEQHEWYVVPLRAWRLGRANQPVALVVSESG